MIEQLTKKVVDSFVFNNNKFISVALKVETSAPICGIRASLGEEVIENRVLSGKYPLFGRNGERAQSGELLVIALECAMSCRLGVVLDQK